MAISKTTRTCLTNTRDDINSTLREVNARIDSHYYQSLGHGYKNVLNVALAHGVPTQIPNPLLNKATPFGAIAINCDTQGLPTLTTGLYSNGVQAATGYIWVTALYPLAEQYLYVTIPTAQALANTVDVAMTLLASKSVGANITFDGSKTITFKSAGRYLVTYEAVVNGSGTIAGEMQTRFVAAGLQWAFIRNPQAGNLPSQSAGVVISLAAGATGQLFVLQSSGSALTINGGYISISQLSNDASLTANVTFSLLAP